MKKRKEPKTPLEEVYRMSETVRKSKAKYPLNRVALATSMLLVVDQLQADLVKFLDKGMESPAKRVRTGTRALETLGKAFRVQSVKQANNVKNR
jgi:hypothetical protein